MKPVIIILLVFCISNELFAQFGGCSCSDPLDANLKTEYSSFDRELFRTFLYDYMYANSRQRKKLKKNKSFGLLYIHWNKK